MVGVRGGGSRARSGEQRRWWGKDVEGELISKEGELLIVMEGAGLALKQYQGKQRCHFFKRYSISNFSECSCRSNRPYHFSEVADARSTKGHN